MHNWKKQHPDFDKLVKHWKCTADAKVERALFERAVGYNHIETKTRWVGDENDGEWKTIDVVKHYPPDTASAQFWLKNKMPNEYSDRQQHEIVGPDGGLPCINITFVTPDDDNEPEQS